MRDAHLRAFPRWISRLAAALTGASATAPAPGRFALVEHVWHLADLEEEAFQRRIARLLAESEPRLPDFEGDRLALERGYLARDLTAGVARFTQQRAATLRTLSGVRGPRRLRAGWQEGVGRVVLREMPDRIAAHDRAHALELLELLEALAPGSDLIAPFRGWIALLPAPIPSPCGPVPEPARPATSTAAPSTSPPATSTEVQREIVAQLGEGRPSLRGISRSLGLSARTLQRQLRAQGLSLHCLVDEARLTLALDQLCAEAPITRVAMESGYADRRALLRALKRWTGRVPTELRRGC
jgi:AraC-like DNA-binding protein